MAAKIATKNVLNPIINFEVLSESKRCREGFLPKLVEEDPAQHCGLQAQQPDRKKGIRFF